MTAAEGIASTRRVPIRNTTRPNRPDRNSRQIYFDRIGARGGIHCGYDLRNTSVELAIDSVERNEHQLAELNRRQFRFFYGCFQSITVSLNGEQRHTGRSKITRLDGFRGHNSGKGAWISA